MFNSLSPCLEIIERERKEKKVSDEGRDGEGIRRRENLTPSNTPKLKPVQ